MRRKTEKRRVCRCSAYHFPHRNGSGACGKGDTPAVLRSGLDAREERAEAYTEIVDAGGDVQAWDDYF
jgi:hypothetical protein